MAEVAEVAEKWLKCLKSGNNKGVSQKDLSSLFKIRSKALLASVWWTTKTDEEADSQFGCRP